MEVRWKITVSGRRGIDIGRDTHLDWTLPDPTRAISGKHCEIRYRDGGYWLYDVSTNGTFLNGSDGRLKAPHQLRDGDRLTIGHYIIAVALEGEALAQQEPAARTLQAAPYHELWNDMAGAAPPVDRNSLKPPLSSAPVRPDFLDWAVDVPEAGEPGFVPAPARPAPSAPDELDWASGPKRQPPPPEPGPAVPSPRRPVWVSSEPSGPWGAPSAEAATIAPAPPERPFAGEEPSPASVRVQPGENAAAASDFAQRVARAAGIPDQTLAQDPERLGMLLRLVTENMRQLLNARLQAKRVARVSNQTMIQALDNNPLKFAPTTEDALRIMFGPPSASYLDAHRALEEAFGDIKEHQVRTYSAMQQALKMLLDDLDPQAIEEAAGSGMLSSRKSRRGILIPNDGKPRHAVRMRASWGVHAVLRRMLR
jgi:type VI secretion system protein ImpI